MKDDVYSLSIEYINYHSSIYLVLVSTCTFTKEPVWINFFL
jgi:hypothetical protein